MAASEVPRSLETWPARAHPCMLSRMLVLTFANQKGGSGKTTLACNVAAALHIDGTKTVVLDIDPQASARTWSARAVALGHDGPSCFAVDASALRRDLARLSESYAVAVIDGPARLGDETFAAMSVADLVVVPVLAGATDLWATAETARVIEKVRAIKPELRAVTVLNRADRTSMARDAEKALENMLSLEPLGVVVRSRVAFGEAMLQGRGVIDVAPKSEAAMEIRRLTRALLAAAVGKKAAA